VTGDREGPREELQGLEELTAVQVAERLGLGKHPEGGYYRETYRSPVEVTTDVGPRALATVILYLLTAEEPSRFHRLRFDEVWSYHAGAPAELALLGEKVSFGVLGVDIPQFLVPAGTWLGARVLHEGQTDWGTGRAPERRWTADRRCSPELYWTLVGCMVTPGFSFHDFELGDRKALALEYPQARKAIRALTAPSGTPTVR
jgi:predicted cupin superfamily sugar epimerase